MNKQFIKNQIDTHSKTLKEQAIELRNIIIKQLPYSIRYLIIEAFKFQRIPQEYLLSSIFNAFGTAIGLSVCLDALGYKNYPNLYTVLVGSRGDTKSLAIKIAFEPISKSDDENYNASNNIATENETLNINEQVSVQRDQIIIKDATVQAALQVHKNNPISIGIVNDEITHLLDKIANKSSSDGMQWRTTLLEGYNNSGIDIARKTTESFRMNKTCPSLIGSIQNQLVYKVFESGNLESGFVDRMLFTVILESNDIVSKQNISEDLTNHYNELLNKALIVRYSPEITLMLDEETEKKLLSYSQSLIDRSLKERSPVKEYLSKLNISIFKLIIIVHSILSLSKYGKIPDKVPIETIQLAIDINDFYLLNFELLLELHPKEIKNATLNSVINFAKQNKITQKEVADFTKKDKSTISRNWNKK